MIIKNNMNLKIEGVKKQLGLSGDVYMVEHFIENLDSHKRLLPESTANTIEEAEQERIAFIQAERIKSSELADAVHGQVYEGARECQSEK